MRLTVDWSYGSAHMLERHGVSVAAANEALSDVEHVVIDPDYNSRTGNSLRVIGWSDTLQDLLSVIVVRHPSGLFGATGWRSNSKDRGIYRAEEADT